MRHFLQRLFQSYGDCPNVTIFRLEDLYKNRSPLPPNTRTLIYQQAYPSRTPFIYQHPLAFTHLTSIMLSTLPLIALFLVQYTSVTIEAPTQTLGGSTSVQSASDLEGQIGDLVIPSEEARNVTTAETRKIRSAPTYATLLSEIGDFALPSNITAGHVAKAAK